MRQARGAKRGNHSVIGAAALHLESRPSDEPLPCPAYELTAGRAGSHLHRDRHSGSVSV